MTGQVSVSEPAPVPATIMVSRCASLMVLNGLAPQATHIPTSLETAPIQVNWLLSKSTLREPISGSRIGPPAKAVIAVPSFGACCARKLAARMPPAPGITCTLTVGLPGMWRPIWRASSRA